MVSQQLDSKYINDALLRDLLTRLFGVGQFSINTEDDDYVLEIPRRLTAVWLSL
ncbi:hypothetical protein NX059_009182 [Plenodomus lindquistii]|nr:hypothetical protein NX059_009182 [Plenodomus lindquistii]